MIGKALKIAYDAHHGQFDKSGAPYIYHPAYLAAQMDTEDEIITALLHDVVEDTAITLSGLEDAGFPQTVLSALRVLTRDRDKRYEYISEKQQYEFYIDEIADNPLAAKVKFADLMHNNNPSRNANLPQKDAARFKEKYDRAFERLGRRVGEREELMRKSDAGDPKAMFKVAVLYYWGYNGPIDRRKAFDLLSQAMETGLPKDQKYASDDYSELNAARFLAAILLRDDDGIMSESMGPFWFEKPPAPYVDEGKEWNDNWDEVSYEQQYQISMQILDIFKCITGRGGAMRDLVKAEHIAQSIVLDLSFGDRDHQPAIDLRTILQCAADEDVLNGKVKLLGW